MRVFVFGSNQQGFHGAGSAGLACRGDSRNNWRTDEWFLKAMKSPENSPERIGKLAIYGIPKGFQRGTEGCSYAIVTVTKPGAKRSIPLEKIREQVLELIEFAREHNDWVFEVIPLGEGYAGYTRSEMNEKVWNMVELPQNIVRIYPKGS